MSDPVKHNHFFYDHKSVFTKTTVRWFLASIATVLISAFLVAGATAAELVVISSSSSNFEAGQIIDSSADLSLAKDVTLTLISENGKVVILQGPHSGPLQVESASGNSGSLILSLKKIISGEKTESGSLGVMRSVGSATLPLDPWAIIAGKTGNYCVSKSGPVVLWRPNSQKTRNLILTNTDTDKEVKTVWHSGQHTLHWPRLLPLVDGATYRVDIAGSSRLPKLSLRMVPDLPTTAHAAIWMAEHGCEKQALRLINNIK